MMIVDLAFVGICTLSGLELSYSHFNTCASMLVLGGINICSYDYCVKFNTVITVLYYIL